MSKIDLNYSVRHLNPERIVQVGRSDEVGDFFLILGVVYNDLKDIHLFFKQNKLLFEARTDTDSLSSENGEYAGINVHLERLLFGTLNEFFDFIQKRQKVFKMSGFKLIYNELSIEHRNIWDGIVDIATKRKTNLQSPLLLALENIRNNSSFHYYGSAPRVKKGFIDFFLNTKKLIPQSKRAYYSIGDSMSNTRFFYCDAAVQQYLISEAEAEKMNYEEFTFEIKSIIKKLNMVIVRLMKFHIKHRPNI